MSDLRLLSNLRVLPEIKNPNDIEKYLKTENRQNIKAIEDGFRRTHNNNTARVADNAARVADNAARVADNAARAAEIAAINALGFNHSISSSCGSYAPGSDTEVDITNITATLTNTKGPIIITLQGDNGGGASKFGMSGSAQLKLFRDGGELRNFNPSAGGLFFPGSFSHIDNDVISSPGSHTYKLRILNGSTGGFTMTNCVLFIYEIRG